MKHVRLPLVALAVLVTLVELPAMVRAQDRPTFSAGVSLVPITVVVRDSRSRIVRDLAREDFQVLENSQPRRILDFRSTDRGPVTMAVLFDTSGSMRGPNLAKGKMVVDRLLTSMDVAADEVSLFTFDNRTHQVTPFTADPGSVRTALAGWDGWGLTSLYDAIADTAKRVAGRPAERRAVIVITDGLDTSSSLTPADVSGLASSIDVPIYVITVVPPRRAESHQAPGDKEVSLADLAFWTGGDLRQAAGSDQMDRAVAELMAELRQQYFLAIESSATSGWYRLDVTTKRRDLTVRTRSGYYAISATRQGS
jgi:Ca-activated chloride channel family protein